MRSNKTKNNESINLVDFFRVFKKNLKIFYFLMVLSTITSIVAVSVNLSSFTNRTNVESTISIKSPIENFRFIDLVTLEKVQVLKDSISLISIKDRISIYYSVTSEYRQVVLNDLKNLVAQNFLNLSGQYYKLEYSTDKLENIKIKMIDVNDTEKAILEAEEFTNKINLFIRELLLTNLRYEVDSFQTLAEDNIANFNDQQKVNLQQRKLNIDLIKQSINDEDVKNLKIFRIDVNVSEKVFQNRSLITLIFLFYITIFLMIVVIRK